MKNYLLKYFLPALGMLGLAFYAGMTPNFMFGFIGFISFFVVAIVLIVEGFKKYQKERR